MDRPVRKHLARHEPIIKDNQSKIVFVTVCTHNRRAVLHSVRAHESVRRAWEMADRWLVGKYVIMPDHIHFFCAPTDEATSLRTWISYWKSLVTKDDSFASPSPLWQSGHFDRDLRSGESYGEKWAYVEHNPVRAGLVREAEDWPYQGEMNALFWDDLR